MVEIVNNSELGATVKSERPHVISLVSSFFVRILGLVILGLSIVLWSHVLGFRGADIQQTFAENEFQGSIMAVLAVVTPLLGVGLWLGMSWARILWGLCGAGLMLLHIAGHPIGMKALIFGASLMVLLVFYYFAQICHFLIIRRKKNIAASISK